MPVAIMPHIHLAYRELCAPTGIILSSEFCHLRNVIFRFQERILLEVLDDEPEYQSGGLPSHGPCFDNP